MPSTCSRCQRAIPDSAESGEGPLYCPFCGQRVRKAPPVEKVAVEELVALALPSNESSALLAGYRLLRHLGSGGMGEVYEAEHEKTRQRVALKFLAKALAGHPTAIERFREVGKLSQLLEHPRCVSVLAMFEDQTFLVLELMSGRTLKDLVEENGPLPPQRAIAYILDVIEGLGQAHRQSILHRDIKPSNCLLTEDDRVKLGDFGLCRVFDAEPSEQRFSGTVLFASPEQIRGEEIDVDSDIYSVCATLYYLLSGRAPHEGTSLTATLAKVISEPAPPLRPKCPAVSAGLEKIVLKGLERDRKRRWPSLDELSEALRKQTGEPRGMFGRLFGRK